MPIETLQPGIVASPGIIPYYREYVIPLAAGAAYDLAKIGNAINVIELTGAVSLSINDGDATPARAGIGYELPIGAVFNRIRVQETAGGAASVTLGIAYGRIQDNRASFAGNQSVQNAAVPNDELQVKTKLGTILQAALAAADPGLVALKSGLATDANIDTEIQAQTAALIAALQASESLRMPFVNLAGYSYANQTGTGGSPQTVVSGAANVNGILLARASVTTNQGGKVCIGAADNILLGNDVSVTASFTDLPQALFIPSGQQLRLICDSASDQAYVWYKVL